MIEDSREGAQSKGDVDSNYNESIAVEGDLMAKWFQWSVPEVWAREDEFSKCVKGFFSEG